MSIFNSEAIQAYLTECVFLNQAVQPDGYGGYINTWTEGAPFDAVITENSTTEAIVAGIAHKTTFYGVKVERKVPLQFHSVFKRLKDGKIFRIRVADSIESPSFSAMDLKQLEAEEFTPTEATP